MAKLLPESANKGLVLDQPRPLTGDVWKQGLAVLAKLLAARLLAAASALGASLTGHEESPPLPERLALKCSIAPSRPSKGRESKSDS